jgi:hypothetical protein
VFRTRPHHVLQSRAESRSETGAKADKEMHDKLNKGLEGTFPASDSYEGLASHRYSTRRQYPGKSLSS